MSPQKMDEEDLHTSAPPNRITGRFVFFTGSRTLDITVVSERTQLKEVFIKCTLGNVIVSRVNYIT